LSAVERAVLGRRVEQEAGFGGDVLIERLGAGDQHHHDGCPRRPARPARCQVAAREPGQPAMTTASRPPMSIAESSADVATTALCLAALELPPRTSRRRSGR
jgi:hypothetical protein